jgi:hypothetical protein
MQEKKEEEEDKNKEKRKNNSDYRLSSSRNQSWSGRCGKQLN